MIWAWKPLQFGVFCEAVLCINIIENAEKGLRVSDLVPDEFKGNVLKMRVLNVFSLIITSLP